MEGVFRERTVSCVIVYYGTVCSPTESAFKYVNEATQPRKMEFPRGEMVLSNSRSWDYFLCRGWIKLFPSFLVRSFLNSCYGLPFLSLVHTGRPRAK